jgi:hypothetical protein
MQTDAPAARTTRLAVASVALALGCLVALIAATVLRSDALLLAALLLGVAAVVLALLAYRAVKRSAGRLGGRRLATAGWLLPAFVLPGSYFLIPRVESRRAAHERWETTARLSQIVKAMNAYTEEHDGLFPAAALRDKEGKPLLSWRVLLLPYLGRRDLFGEFRRDEPWDSPHNRALLPRMPDVYSLDFRGDAPFTTPFQVFVGPDTPFGEAKGPNLIFSFENGTARTIAVIVARKAVPWTEPADLPYDPDKPLPLLGSTASPWFFRKGGTPTQAAVGMFDGSLRAASLRPEHEWQLRLAILSDGPGIFPDVHE